ncbi:MAG TPA: amidohydrolase family protein [Candidatus Mediterraneibacter merdipullorum]|nr:amidohydrolase family protein [Candidatus Mediterraneibacter merdipullorum]
MCDLMITDAAVLFPDGSVRFGQTIEIADGRIKDVRPALEWEKGGAAQKEAESGQEQDGAAQKEAGSAQERAGERISGRGKLVMPGLADCHMHTGQQLLKGRVLDALPMIWTRIMLPFESTLTDKKMELSASIAALEMIKSGTTAFVDAGSYHMEAAAEVYVRSGLRGLISASTMDEEGLPESIAQDADEALAQTDRLYDGYHGKGNLKVAYSLRSLMSCSDGLVRKVSGRAKERGAKLQAHMNEYAGEVNHSLTRRQMRPFEYLDAAGVLDADFIAAHCLLLSEREKELLAARGVSVCHCPFSNCGKGAPDTPSLQARGICVGLGTDGAAHAGLSLWNEMKIFRSVMNVEYGSRLNEPAVMPAGDILRMATENGYRLMGEDGGCIAPGKQADLITIDLMQPHLYPTGNVVHTLLECVTAADVCDSVVNGRVLMRDRKVLTLDEERILGQAAEYMEREGRCRERGEETS